MTVRSFVLALAATAVPALAQTVAAPFDQFYTPTNLGSVTGVPNNYGCMAFLPENPNVMLLGGAANGSSGRLYEVPVIRNASGTITGFGAGVVRPNQGANNDGGMTFLPDGTMIVSRYPNRELGVSRPGSLLTDQIINMTPLCGAAAGTSGVLLVPARQPGAGRLKLTNYEGGGSGSWWDLEWSQGGDGSLVISAATRKLNFTTGPEGFVYVPLCSPGFFVRSILLCEFGAGRVSAIEIDGNGDPIAGTSRPFITGLSGAEGAVIDPVTGDFLFCTYGGGNRIVRVQGFNRPDACPVDFNDDCFVDFFDYDDYVNCFEGGGCPTGRSADFNGDDFVDFFDYDDFVSAFETGC